MIASILPDIDMSDSVKFGFQVWNTFMKSVYALLTESPSQFKDGEIWKAVQKINPYFITVGTIAVSLCFAMGLVKNQVDLKREMNIEMAIKLFARISIAEWLLTNTFYIIDAIFSAATWLIGKVLTGGVKKMSLSKAQLKLFEEVDPIESIVLLIFGFICLVVVIVLAMVMIYTVYSRFFKVYVSGGMGHVARANLQNMITYALEGVAISMTLFVCSKFIGSGLDLGLKTGNSDTVKAMAVLIEKTFTIALTVGLTKGAENLVRKNLGL